MGISRTKKGSAKENGGGRRRGLFIASVSSIVAQCGREKKKRRRRRYQWWEKEEEEEVTVSGLHFRFLVHFHIIFFSRCRAYRNPCTVTFQCHLCCPALLLALSRWSLFEEITSRVRSAFATVFFVCIKNWTHQHSTFKRWWRHAIFCRLGNV